MDGVLTPPQNNSAALTTVAGLNVGDPIVVDATDGTRHMATVAAVNPASRVVTFTPAITGGFTARQDAFIRSTSQLDTPAQSAMDAAGLIYTADSTHDRLIVFNSHGTTLWTLGSHGRIYDDGSVGLSGEDGFGPCDPVCPNNPAVMLDRFFLPSGVDVSPDGSTIVVSDNANHRVVVFRQNPAGAIAATAGAVAGPHFDAYSIGGFGGGVGQLVTPAGVSLGAAGRIAVADWGNNRIEVFTPSATGVVIASDGSHRFTPIAFGHGGSEMAGPGDPGFSRPNDVEFDKSGTATGGRIVVADSDNHRVQIFSAAGVFITAIQTDVVPSSVAGDFNTPTGVTVDELGLIYVADFNNSRIQIFAPAANGLSYSVTDVFGAEQTSDPIPGEVAFIGPAGVAVSGGRLVVTELDGSRLKMLTRAALVIDAPVTVNRTTLALQDPANNLVHVIVRVRNVSSVALTDVALSATANYGGTFSPVLPVQTDLGPAGSASDSATFEFDFTVTGAGDGSTLHLTLSAVGEAGTVVVSASPTVDTAITITQPTGAAVALGTIGVTPTRAGVNQHVTVTVPVQNVGGQPLSNVAITVTATPGGLLMPSTDSRVIASLPTHTTQPVSFDFMVQTADPGASRFVRFNISLTAHDAGGHAVPDQPLMATAPAAPGVEIVSDNIAPVLAVAITPAPNPRSLDGKDWYNGSATPCAAISCPPPPVFTWPTLRVTAADEANGSGLQRIGWRMVDTTNQPQSDQTGTCSQASGSLPPSSCTSGPNGTLLWNRTLTEMQGRIVLAFWAEDQAGNGAAAANDQLACLAPGVPPGVFRVNLVTCVTLFIDVQPPTLTRGPVTLNANNTEARIPFTDGDPISGVSSMTSPDATLVLNGTASGTLVVRSEGTAVIAHLVVTDFARNATTLAIPFQGSDQLPVRLDHTPPEVFNRVDPAALGQRCTTTIAGQPVTYACTNKVYATDNLPGLTTAAFAPISVVPARWDGDFDDDHNWDNLSAELHTYSLTDAFVPASGPVPVQSPNRVTLIEKARQSGNEARVHVISFQYQQGAVAGPVIKPDWAFKKYEWDTNSDGSLKSLTQKFELRDGWHRTEITATFDARRNVTRISAEGPRVECDDRDHRHDRDVDNNDDETAAGLILLRMTTRSGTLKIEYDVHSPVPVPDLAPPVLTLSSSKTVEATGPEGAAVTFTSSAVDAVDGVLPVTCTALSGSVFPLGTTTVGCSATDATGNVTRRTMTVTVRDTTRPGLTLPSTIAVTTSSSGANVSFTVSAVDAISGNRAVSCSPGSGSRFKVGTTSVSCSASDSAGNTATGVFIVIVRKN